MELFLLIFVCAFLFFVGLRATAWGRRTSKWLRSLGVSGVETAGAKFSDFVGFTGFSLSLLGLILGWYSISLQTRKANLDQEIRDYSDRISAKQQQLYSLTHELSVSESGAQIRLGAPIRNMQLIGSHVDLEWSYARHSNFVSYVLEVINKRQSELNDYSAADGPCRLDKYRSCLFMATDPAGQRSQLFSANVGTLKGEYLWRVVPSKSAGRVATTADIGEVSDWSELSSFTIYPSILERVVNGGVLIGTTYSDDVRFSTRNEQGQPEGHDIDLIHVLVEGCISVDRNKREIKFDPSSCHDTITSYMSTGKYSLRRRPEQLPVKFRPFSSAIDGLAALSRRELDVFVGSLTKARKRENGRVLFTDGYYRFDSKLYSHRGQTEQDIEEWAAGGKRIGVIRNSTNHWLASLLTGEPSLQNSLTVITFQSYPALESAFERGDVDGALLDSVLGDTLQDAFVITGLDSTRAWKTYHDEYLGGTAEEFGIAMAVDTEREMSGDGSSGSSAVPTSTNPIFPALQEALRDDEVTNHLLPFLRTKYHLSEPLSVVPALPPKP